MDNSTIEVGRLVKNTHIVSLKNNYNLKYYLYTYLIIAYVK